MSNKSLHELVQLFQANANANANAALKMAAYMQNKALFINLVM